MSTLICLPSELYCDGVRHCPSGFDEREENCAHVFAPLLYMYAVAIVTVAAVICVAIAVVQRMRSRTVFRSTGRRRFKRKKIGLTFGWKMG